MYQSNLAIFIFNKIASCIAWNSKKNLNVLSHQCNSCMYCLCSHNIPKCVDGFWETWLFIKLVTQLANIRSMFAKGDLKHFLWWCLIKLNNDYANKTFFHRFTCAPGPISVYAAATHRALNVSSPHRNACESHAKRRHTRKQNTKLHLRFILLTHKSVFFFHALRTERLWQRRNL